MYVRLLAPMFAAILLAATPGCGRTVEGTPVRGSGGSKAEAPLMSVADLKSLMPLLEQSASVMKAAAFVVASTSDRVEPLPADVLSDPACLVAFFGNVEAALAGSGYLGIYEERIGDQSTDFTRRADISTVAFGDAGEARAYVAKQIAAWKRCANKTMTVKTDRHEVTWTLNDPVTARDVPVQLHAAEGATGYACARAIAARSNVVADVAACSDDNTDLNDQAATLVNLIINKIP
jgi:serine/threonine kinase PknH